MSVCLWLFNFIIIILAANYNFGLMVFLILNPNETIFRFYSLNLFHINVNVNIMILHWPVTNICNLTSWLKSIPLHKIMAVWEQDLGLALMAAILRQVHSSTMSTCHSPLQFKVVT